MLEPCSAVLKSLADCLHNGLQMSLIGADVIVENDTGLHYVIDVNAFPGKNTYTEEEIKKNHDFDVQNIHCNSRYIAIRKNVK